MNLSIGFLETGTSTASSKLLGFASARISNQERSVVGEEDSLDFCLGGLIDVLLVVSNDGLGDGLTDGIDLRSVTTTLHANSDIDVGESVVTEQEDGLVDLESEDFRSDEFDGVSVDLD